jgi:hypothetical protein
VDGHLILSAVPSELVIMVHALTVMHRPDNLWIADGVNDPASGRRRRLRWRTEHPAPVD